MGGDAQYGGLFGASVHIIGLVGGILRHITIDASLSRRYPISMNSLQQ